MNTRYDDATVEDIEREDTCIICREEMRPWSVTNPQEPPAAPGAPPQGRTFNSPNERTRPKKLPCGHILHLGCLKSWLERQQVCPTCRASVVDTPQTRAAGNNANPGAPGVQPPAPGQQNGPVAAPQPPAAPRAAGRMRMLNFGPLRVGFGQANLQDLPQGLGGQQPNQQNNAVAGGPRMYGLELGFPRRQPQPQAQGTTNVAGSTQEQLQQIEQQIVAEIRGLQLAQQELQLVQLLQIELARLRLLQNGGPDPLATNLQMPQMGALGARQSPFSVTVPQVVPQMQRHGARPNTAAIPSGSGDLPPGVTIPEGWSLLPLQRLDGQTQNGPAASSGSAPTATTTQPGTISPMSRTSNNNLTPTPTTNPDNPSQASSVHSSDTNAISTPPSVVADQSTFSNVASNTTLPSTTLHNIPALNASSDVSQNPSVLPNWGSSQLFSGPTSTAGNTNAIPSFSTMPPPPNSGDALPQGSHVERSTSADAHVSRVASATTTEQGGDSASSEEITSTSDERSESKGKGRAPFVEDADDEAEGS